MQSGLSSSLVETSEDEEAKRKEAEKAAKAAKRGLSKEELENDYDIVIEETETIFLLHIPSSVVPGAQGDNESDEARLVAEQIEKYKQFPEY